MKANTGVKMIPLQGEAFGKPMVIYPTLLWDDDRAVLVDTGMPGSWETIRQEMSRAGIPPERLQTIILTHQDLDHIGSLPEIVRELGGQVEIYAHELDQPYIEGTLPLLKANPKSMAPVLAMLPEKEREYLQWLCENPPKAMVHKTLADAEILPYCGGIRIIHTPGHTPGHISLYIQDSKTLIAGDAMVYMNEALRGPIPLNTLDMEMAVNSLKKFENLEINSIICYHGGMCQNNVQEQLHALIR
jgi:glyoxylase-like metal-dependent hydrolase (beta-lactamase superfamily II)